MRSHLGEIIVGVDPRTDPLIVPHELLSRYRPVLVAVLSTDPGDMPCALDLARFWLVAGTESAHRALERVKESFEHLVWCLPARRHLRV